MEKKSPIIGIANAIIAGVPLAKQIIGLFSKKKKASDVELNSMSKDDLINQVKNVQNEDEKSLLIKLANLVLTGATVYFVIWTAKHFGITSQEILDLFGVLK